MLNKISNIKKEGIQTGIILKAICSHQKEISHHNYSRYRSFVCTEKKKSKVYHTRRCLAGLRCAKSEQSHNQL